MQVQLRPCEGCKDCEVAVDGCFVEPVSCFPSVVAPAVSLTGGKWYYEARVIKPGAFPQIGWADDAFTTSPGNGVGDDAHSWGVDGVRIQKWHNGGVTGEGGKYGLAWKVGDVVGLAADLDGRTIAFSLNGSWAAPMGVAFTDVAVQGGLRPALTLGCVRMNSPTRCSCALWLHSHCRVRAHCDTSVGLKVSVNFGESAFSFSPPDAEYGQMALPAAGARQ